jgi:hypothetical protein
MKFQAPWFLDGKEVELPEMKIEGSLAVAELMKKHVDEFLPFVLAMQEEATCRLRVSVLSEIQTAGANATDEHKAQLKTLCKLYGTTYIEDESLKVLIDNLITRAIDDLTDCTKKTARVQITSTPFFLERSLIEAYFMLKAHVFDEARKLQKPPRMTFTLDDLKTLINDAELAAFARHSMERMKNATEPEEPSLEMPSEEDIKKKLTTDLTKSAQ